MTNQNGDLEGNKEKVNQLSRYVEGITMRQVSCRVRFKLPYLVIEGLTTRLREKQKLLKDKGKEENETPKKVAILEQGSNSMRKLDIDEVVSV